MGFLVIGFNFDDGKTVKYQTNINHQQKAKKKSEVRFLKGDGLIRIDLTFDSESNDSH